MGCHDRLCAEAVQKKGSAWEEQRDLKKFTLKDGADGAFFFLWKHGSNVGGLTYNLMLGKFLLTYNLMLGD